MLWRGPRVAVTRPCAGCALPWNASFMTIPFEVGIFAKAPPRFELPLEPATLGPRVGGFAVCGCCRTTAICSCAVGFVSQAGRRPRAGCRPFSRSSNCLPPADIRRVLHRADIRPVDRIPYGGGETGVTRRNICHNSHGRRGARLLLAASPSAAAGGVSAGSRDTTVGAPQGRVGAAVAGAARRAAARGHRTRWGNSRLWCASWAHAKAWVTRCAAPAAKNAAGSDCSAVRAGCGEVRWRWPTRKALAGCRFGAQRVGTPVRRR